MVPADEVGEILTIFRAQTAAYLSEASLEGGSKVPVGAAAAPEGIRTHNPPTAQVLDGRGLGCRSWMLGLKK